MAAERLRKGLEALERVLCGHNASDSDASEWVSEVLPYIFFTIVETSMHIFFDSDDSDVYATFIKGAIGPFQEKWQIS